MTMGKPQCSRGEFCSDQAVAEGQKKRGAIAPLLKTQVVSAESSLRIYQLHLAGQSQRLQQTNVHPGEVNLPPLEAMPSRMLEGVVVVVPTFAVGHQGHPPAVGGGVVGVVSAVAKFVGGTVHKPGAVIHHHQADKNTPNDERPTAERIQHDREGQLCG